MGCSKFIVLKNFGYRKCEVYEVCSYYSRLSATCFKNGGGSYCGKYREMKRKAKNNV